MKKLTPAELEAQIYGNSSLYDRVVAEIKNLGISAAARKIEVTTQMLYMFMTAKNEDGTYKHKPKLETITKYAYKLGVE